ncbi:acyl-CoA desaturase-like isoform X2 [Littorina saxatilis]|uniref:Fatty acid desaturase domain-containing protein n=2 Tax=Littorina saxatilis TaxID=31220 RepID=A0AAN9GJZ5_9CAEN
MAPKTPVADVQSPEGLEDEVEPVILEENHSQKRPPMVIVWRNVVLFLFLHFGALYAAFLVPKAHPLTLLWSFALYIMAGWGITAGAHRLWAHRSYKAKLPLRLLLIVFNSIAFQNDVIEWSRDHRVHHKYSETDADPHNARRGFFFAHMGWLLVRKHPDVKVKGQAIDLSDLKRDPVLRLQRKIYKPLMLSCCFIIPTVVPWYFWGESLWNAYFIAAVLRYTLGLNATWLVNSAAHMWGNKPYDRNINPSQNLGVSFSAVGEGFHNYHHVFPHDYSTSEYGWHINLTTMFIDIMAVLGLAYDRRRIPTALVLKRRARTGDGTE